MSRYLVVMNFEIDPADFVGVENTEHAVRNLVLAMCAGQVDFPTLLSMDPSKELRLTVDKKA